MPDKPLRDQMDRLNSFDVLSENDLAFLTKRRRLVALWPVVATVLLVGLGGFALWAWLKVPHLVSPRSVAEAIANGTMDQPSLETIAVLFPVLLWWGIVVIPAILIGLGFATVAKEKRYLAIITRLKNQEQETS